jgi:hypothetical protein
VFPESFSRYERRGEKVGQNELDFEEGIFMRLLKKPLSLGVLGFLLHTLNLAAQAAEDAAQHQTWFLWDAPTFLPEKNGRSSAVSLWLHLRT